MTYASYTSCDGPGCTDATPLLDRSGSGWLDITIHPHVFASDALATQYYHFHSPVCLTRWADENFGADRDAAEALTDMANEMAMDDSRAKGVF